MADVTAIVTDLVLPGEGEDFDEQQRLWDLKSALNELSYHSQQLSSISYSPTRLPTTAPTLPPNVLLKPPNCITSEADLGYVNGQLSFDETFKNCLRNIADAEYLPTFMNGSIAGTMNVATNIVLNNLHEIDSLVSKVSLDFYLRLYWRDNRFNMPLYWDRVQPSVRRDGITIRIASAADAQFWLPDVRFHDVDSFDVLAMTLRVNSSNVFFWSRHIKGDFMQPDLQFHKFPQDNQTLHIRYGSYAFNSGYLKLNILEPGITYNRDYADAMTFTKNPVWNHKSSWTTHSTYLSSSNFQNVVFSISMARNSLGIMSRFVFPIAILSVIGGLLFWSHPEDRVTLTVTLLLSVAALYVVVIDNIPLVGYLTAIDKYVMLIFIILGLAVFMHQLYYSLNNHSQHSEFMDELEHGTLQAASQAVPQAAPQAPDFPTLSASAVIRRRMRKVKSLRRAVVSILFDGRVVVGRILQTLGRLMIVPAAGIAVLIVFTKRDTTFATALVALMVIGMVVLVLEVSSIAKDIRKAKKYWTSVRDLKAGLPMVRFWQWMFGDHPSHPESPSVEAVSAQTKSERVIQDADLDEEEQLKGSLEAGSISFFSHSEFTLREESSSANFSSLLFPPRVISESTDVGDKVIFDSGVATHVL